MITPILEINSLHEQVERIVKKDKITYTSAIIHFCEKHELDPTDVGKIISGPLREKLKIEAQSLNIIKGKSASLSKFL